MLKVSVVKPFVAKQSLRSVRETDAVEYKLMGLHVHLLIPGMPAVVLTRKEFSELLSSGTLLSS